MRLWLVLVWENEGNGETVWILEKGLLDDMGINPDDFELKEFEGFASDFEHVEEVIEVEVIKGRAFRLPTALALEKG